MKQGAVGFLCLLLLCISCGGIGETRPGDNVPAPDISDFTLDGRKWADTVTSHLTLRQKIAQLFMPALYAQDDFWTLRQIREYADNCLGGIILLKGDIEGASSLIDSLRRSASVPPFIAIDAEWGLAMRLVDAPGFPQNNEIGEDVGEQLMYDYGYELARECRQLGINMVLGPVVDVSGPDSFVRRRSFGDDPVRVADLAIAYARGLEDGDVISVAKHFPGHGSVSSDSHKRKGIIDRSFNEMDSVDLYPFRKWVEQRLSGIMVGHLAVPSIDSRMLPAAVSGTVINDLLRDEIGFNGLVLTDALNMRGAEGFGAVDAFLAGADIVIAPANTFKEIDKVVEAVSKGRITEEEIDKKVKSVLFYKYSIGLWDSAGTTGDPANVPSAKADTISRLLRE